MIDLLGTIDQSEHPNVLRWLERVAQALSVHSIEVRGDFVELAFPMRKRKLAALLAHMLVHRLRG